MKFEKLFPESAERNEWILPAIRYECVPGDEADFQEQELEWEHPGGIGVYREIHFDRIYIGYLDLSLHEKLTVRRRVDFERVSLQFVLNGSGEIIFENTGKLLKLGSHQHNIFYSKKSDRKMVWEPGEVRYLEVQISSDFFEKYLPEEHHLFDIFRKEIKRAEFAQIADHSLPVSPKMVGVVLDIVHCHCNCVLKRMLLETKVLELMLLQMNQMFEENCPVCSLKKSDVEKMHSVRKFILANMAKDYSLGELAREVGTNEFTLKKGFKELFGMTVFGFWNMVKMDQAKKLLLDSELNIGEIAGKVGFKHPQHFTTAFKRRFGIVPSQFRKS